LHSGPRIITLNATSPQLVPTINEARRVRIMASQPLCPTGHEPLDLSGTGRGKEIVCSTCASSFRLDRDATLTRVTPGGQRTLGELELMEMVGSVYKARAGRLRVYARRI